MNEPENDSGEQEVSKWSTCWRGRTGVVIIVFLILTSVVTLSVLLIFVSLSKSCSTKEKDDCSQSLLGKICGGAFVFTFLISGFAIIYFNKRWRKRSLRQVVVSEIPSEDIEKSPAPMLPYNHIPQHSPFGEASPNYYAAVQNIQDVSSQLNKGFWTEDIDDSDDENPPPCYEQAVKMSTLPATVTDKEIEPRKSDDTRL